MSVFDNDFDLKFLLHVLKCKFYPGSKFSVQNEESTEGRLLEHRQEIRHLFHQHVLLSHSLDAESSEQV